MPIAPSQGVFLKSNGSSTLLNFNEWQSGGCPVKYYVVQFRSDINREWQSLAQPIPGDQETYLIKDLVMETWYRLRVSAHNEGGTTEAEYAFSTSASDRINSMSQPGWSISDEEIQWMNIVLFPVLATIIIVGCVGIVVYGVRRKPRNLEIGKWWIQIVQHFNCNYNYRRKCVHQRVDDVFGAGANVRAHSQAESKSHQPIR